MGSTKWDHWKQYTVQEEAVYMYMSQCISLWYLQNASGYDQDTPKSQTADQPMAPSILTYSAEQGVLLVWPYFVYSSSEGFGDSVHLRFSVRFSMMPSDAISTDMSCAGSYMINYAK